MNGESPAPQTAPAEESKPAPAQAPAEGDRETLPDEVKPPEQNAPGR